MSFTFYTFSIKSLSHLTASLNNIITLKNMVGKRCRKLVAIVAFLVFTIYLLLQYDSNG